MAGSRVPPWLLHGWREFCQSWRQLHRRVPGGRDFLSLSLIHLLIVAIVVLGIGANRGFLSSFADSLIGSLRGWGVPIWVTADLGRIRKGIDAEILAEFGNWPDGEARRSSKAFPDLAIHPLREVEPASPLARFVDPRSWRSVVGGSVIEFRGWAVHLESPLWRWAVGAPIDREAELRTIVLNRSIMLPRWNYAVYRQSLRGQLPDHVVDALPEHLGEPGSIDTIFLRVALSGTRGQVVPFRVVWADSLPVLQKIAFLLPMETVALLDLNFQFDGIRYMPAFDADDRARVRDMIISNVDRLSGGQRAQVERSLDCTGAGQVERGPFDVRKSFGVPIPERWARECLQRSGLVGEGGIRPSDLAFRIEERVTFAMRAGRVTVPCAALPLDRVSSAIRAECSGRREPGDVDIAVVSGYPSAYVYARDRASLFQVKERLTGFRSKADGAQVFYLAEAYQDALDRFFYLSEFISYVVWPVAVSGLVFLIYVMTVFLHSILARRRIYYGVLMARGFTVADVRRIIFVQLAMSVVAGGAVAIVASELLKLGVDCHFAQSALADFARGTLGIREPVLMPRIELGSWQLFAGSVGEAAAIGLVATLGVLVVSTVLCALILRILPLRAGTTPIDLMIVTQPDSDEALPGADGMQGRKG